MARTGPGQPGKSLSQMNLRPLLTAFPEYWSFPEHSVGNPYVCNVLSKMYLLGLDLLFQDSVDGTPLYDPLWPMKSLSSIGDNTELSFFFLVSDHHSPTSSYASTPGASQGTGPVRSDRINGQISQRHGRRLRISQEPRSAWKCIWMYTYLMKHFLGQEVTEVRNTFFLLGNSFCLAQTLVAIMQTGALLLYIICENVTSPSPLDCWQRCSFPGQVGTAGAGAGAAITWPRPQFLQWLIVAGWPDFTGKNTGHPEKWEFQTNNV